MLQIELHDADGNTTVITDRYNTPNTATYAFTSADGLITATSDAYAPGSGLTYECLIVSPNVLANRSNDALSIATQYYSMLIDINDNSDVLNTISSYNWVLSDISASIDILGTSNQYYPTLFDINASSDVLISANLYNRALDDTNTSNDSLSAFGSYILADINNVSNDTLIAISSYNWTLSDINASSDLLSSISQYTLTLSDTSASSDNVGITKCGSYGRLQGPRQGGINPSAVNAFVLAPASEDLFGWARPTPATDAVIISWLIGEQDPSE